MDLQLGEVVNPHYAYPIVGVILCAVLVFAFGFKSPAQPPSFDLGEYERKINSKKRKTKEAQKHKVQNGQTATASPKLPATKNVQNVPEVIFKPKTEKSSPRNKSEPKQKKVVPQESSIEKEPEVPPVSEENEGEWVQKLSKKGKKNRRREEREEEPVQSPVTDTSADSHENTPSKQKKKKEVKTSEEPAEVTKPPTEEEVAVAEEPSKKEESGPETVVKEEVSPKTEETSQVEKKPDPEEHQETEIKSKAKKKKGKKKGSPDVNAVTESLASSKEIQQENNLEPEPTVTQASQITEPPPPPPPPEKSEDAPVDVSASHQNDEVPATGSNIAFDELGDIPSQDSKQKRKKKARRE